jgi:hypothetical protein
MHEKMQRLLILLDGQIEAETIKYAWKSANGSESANRAMSTQNQSESRRKRRIC